MSVVLCDVSSTSAPSRDTCRRCTRSTTLVVSSPFHGRLVTLSVWCPGISLWTGAQLSWQLHLSLVGVSGLVSSSLHVGVGHAGLLRSLHGSIFSCPHLVLTARLCTFLLFSPFETRFVFSCLPRETLWAVSFLSHKNTQ